MAFKAICIILVIAVLLEDGSSMRKKTDEEKKEDRELAEKVNATLIEEEKKKAEEERKKTTDVKKTEGQEDGDEGQKGQDEARSTVNCTCPIVEPCPKVQDCPVPLVNCLEVLECRPCPECPKPKECIPCNGCPPCEECGPCPTVKPCKPCPTINNTSSRDTSSTTGCPEAPGMSLPVAVAVGAMAGMLLTGVATTIGILLRYTSAIESGFVFLAVIILVWYFSSQYPETARELGGRATNLLREAAVALGHRMMAAIQRHQEQVGFPVNPSLFLRMSSIFPKEKFALRFSMC
jgi:hypothetical protein